MTNMWSTILTSFTVGVASAVIVLWIALATRRREFMTTRSFDAWVRSAQMVSVLVGVSTGCILGGAIVTMTVAPPLSVLRLLTISAGLVTLGAGFGVVHRARSAPFRQRLAASRSRGMAFPSRVVLAAIGAWSVTIAYVIVQTFVE